MTTLRLIALVLAAALTVPATARILRTAPPAAGDPSPGPGRRALERTFLIAPAVLLVALLALAATHG